MEAALSTARRGQLWSVTRIQQKLRRGAISEIKEAAPSTEGRGQKSSAARRPLTSIQRMQGHGPNLGCAGGGTVDGKTWTEVECCQKALDLDPTDARAWSNLGCAGGGTVDGKTWTEVECYQKALDLDPKFADAWFNLGCEGGGTVDGKTWSNVECYQNALEADPTDAQAWCNLGR